MEDRTKIIYKAGEDILQNCLLDNLSNMQQGIDRDFESMMSAIDELLKKIKEQQSELKEKAIAYISFSFLRSSHITKTYAFRIDAYDTKHYADLEYRHVYWYPEQLFEYYAGDEVYFRKEVTKKIVRIKEYEIREFLNSYIFHYYLLIQKLIEAASEQIADKLQKDDIITAEDLQITYGGYLEENLILWKSGATL